MFDLEPDLGQLSLLKFKDFVPASKSYSIWTRRGKQEPLVSALQEANVWIAANPDVEILNIETVVLPNIHSPREEGSEDTELRLDHGMAINWHQFFRVWYIQKRDTT